MKQSSRIVPNRPAGPFVESSSVPPPLGARTIRGTEGTSAREFRPEHSQAFGAFVAALAGRLEAGRVAYGNASFTRDPAELVGELQQEALDLAGWGYILFCRLEAMRDALSEPGDLIPARATDGGKVG